MINQICFVGIASKFSFRCINTESLAYSRL